MGIEGGMDAGTVPELFTGDLDEDFVGHVFGESRVAWDIETTGLDPRCESIGTCQIATSERVGIVRIVGNGAPDRLLGILGSPDVCKVFHHAPFDLRFMIHHWGATPARIGCTKVLAKILEPGLGPGMYSLQSLLARYLGVSIDKGQRRSDWLASELSREQVEYATGDVLHLLPLFDLLFEGCVEAGLADLAHGSLSYLPARAVLDLRECGDVFSY